MKQNLQLLVFRSMLFTFGVFSFQMGFAQSNCEEVESTLLFNLDNCLAGTSFTEFTAELTQESPLLNISVAGNNLYRNNPTYNSHSCTDGVNGSIGMCITSLNSCTYDGDSEKSLVMDIVLNPIAGEARLAEINFYEMAPEIFTWTDGGSGVNNYPTVFGIRVSRDGNVIYTETGIQTSRNYTQQIIEFPSNADFVITESETFKIELLPYCFVGNSGFISVWDLDEIEVKGMSTTELMVQGGTLTGGPFEFCVGDGQDDNIADADITLAGNAGTNSQWVVTDDQGNILGLPPTFSAVNFDGAGPGTCLIWHLSFEDGLTGAEMGMNANDLQGCFSLSNPISVVRNQPQGGTLTGGPFEFCVGDGQDDFIPAGAIIASGGSGTNTQWVVTDEQGSILGLPPTYEAVNFDGAQAGTCLVWYLRYEDGVEGLVAGQNANDLQGCFSLSNPISVVRNQPQGGTLTGGPFEFCVGDGIDDNIDAADITLAGNAGTNSQWVVTDDQGNILGLPPTFSAVNFDGAGTGTCLIWHLSFEDGLTGAEMGMNANDLQGCFSLSNPISVVRNQPQGGTLTGGPFEFCVGDGIDDNIDAADITLAGNAGTNSQWVVTDDQGNILGLPPTFSAVNFDGAGTGTCLIWHLSFEDGLTGAEMGMNANDLQGCFSLSNPISVVRNQPQGGTLTGGPFEFCVGDGIDDNIADADITLAGNAGTNSQWVVTDDQGNILGLPPTFSAVNFDGAGTGTCLIWHLSFEDGLTGAEMGMNANDLQGCFSLSNPISVVRNQPQGGTLTGGPFEFCVGDGIDDNIADTDITLAGNAGTNSQWVVTDDQGNILGLPPTFSAVNFDGAGTGTCLIWHLSFEDGLTGAEMGMNANDLQGCFSLSNPIEVNRIDCNGVNGGILEGGPFEFCVGDGEIDNVSGITLSGNTGTNNQWVITDELGNILGLPPMPGVVDFDGAGPGICLIWNIAYEDGLEGLVAGNNATTDLVGSYSLSNSISVTRNQPEGGTLTGGPFEFCVGDGEADMIATGDITLAGNSGTNSQWVVTDDQGNILGLPPTFSDVDFDGAGTGTCLIWHLSFEDGLTGAEMGMNANDLQGCFSLSNSIEVTRIDCNLSNPDKDLNRLSVKVYPNPSSDFVILENTSKVELEKVTIINNVGQVTQRYTRPVDDNSLIIKINDLQNGQYFIIIEGSNQKIVKKLAIIK